MSPQNSIKYLSIDEWIDEIRHSNFDFHINMGIYSYQANAVLDIYKAGCKRE